MLQNNTLFFSLLYESYILFPLLFSSAVSFFGNHFIVNTLIFYDGYALMYSGLCETLNLNYL